MGTEIMVLDRQTDRQTDEVAKTISLQTFLGDKKIQDQKYNTIFNLFPHIYSNNYIHYNGPYKLYCIRQNEKLHPRKC